MKTFGRLSTIPDKSPFLRWGLLAALAAAVLAVFAGRTAAAQNGTPARLFTIFNSLILLCSLGVLWKGYRSLKLGDWLLAAGVSVLLGVQLPLTSFYPLLPIHNSCLAAAAHTAGLAVIWLAGLAVMRQGGPVKVQVALGKWAPALTSLALGIGLGLPLAVLNALAFSFMESRPLAWQNPLAAAASALQPGIVEEVVYRLALLGFFWILLRQSWPRRAVLFAATLSLLVHNYAHFDELFRDQPLFALGYGGLVALLFGLPMTFLAVRRDLETAVGFHWVVDFVRFFAGF